MICSMGPLETCVSHHLDVSQMHTNYGYVRYIVTGAKNPTCNMGATHCLSEDSEPHELETYIYHEP